MLEVEKSQQFGASDQACLVLLVDDHEPLLTVLAETLKAHGFRVHAVNRASDAVETLNQETPDIIICDILMPGMDGFEFQSLIRSRADVCNIPFVFLSALSAPDQIKFGTLQGCDAYVTKPFDPSELLTLIQGKVDVFRKRRSQSDKRLEDYRRRIVHTLSHEFRTPLVAINTGAELLLDQYDNIDREKARELVESIHRGGQRLQRLIEDFMMIQHIDSGQAEIAWEKHRSKCSLLSLAESAVASFMESILETEVDIRVSDESGYSLSVDVCASQVVDVVKRLLSNAYKFGGATKPIVVAVRTGADANGMRYNSLLVRDYGLGVPEAALLELGQRFLQIERDRFEQQGCGLGLSIAAYFVALNQGEMYFRNVDGAGLEVEIRLSPSE